MAPAARPTWRGCTGCLQNSFVEQVPQLVCYVTGVGTQEGERLRGGAFGDGLSDNIIEAYRFLVDHYEGRRFSSISSVSAGVPTRPAASPGSSATADLLKARISCSPG